MFSVCVFGAIVTKTVEKDQRYLSKVELIDRTESSTEQPGQKNPLAILNCVLSLFPESDDLKCFSCSVNILGGIAIKTVERIKDI